MAGPIQVAFNAGFVVSAEATNPSCSTGLGTVTATFSDGIGTYQCKLDNGSFGSCTSPFTYNNVGSGSHTVTVKDSSPGGGCQKTTNAVTITIPSAVNASSSNTTILCHGGNSTVTVSATGGTAPYSGTGTFSVPAGTYSYTVTDHNGCLSTTTGTITEPDAVVASSSNTAILCHGGNSTVTVSATGGTAPYSGTGTFSVPAGTYSYTVTDANGCTATTTGNIRQPTALTLSLVAGCAGTHDGSITATFGGGTGPYQVKIDSGNYTTQTSPYTFTGLTGGQHTVTVRDANQCSNPLQIAVDPCVGFCALTMGGYGNPGGMYNNPDSCYNGLRTLALIQALLGDPNFITCGNPNPNPQSLIVGVVGFRSLTIPLSAASCIMMRLPANGTPDTLPNQFGDQTLQNSPSCQVPGPKLLPLKNGKFANVLLGQTITLGFNLRLDPTLANLDLTTIGTPGGTGRGAYRQFCTQRGGTIQTWRISQGVINALSNPNYVPDATHRGKVSGLLDLANYALSGQSTGSVNLSDINAAINAINAGFDGCAPLVTCPL
jgi:hypothetical protein